MGTLRIVNAAVTGESDGRRTLAFLIVMRLSNIVSVVVVIVTTTIIK